MPKIATIDGVNRYGDTEPLELWREEETGRLVIRVWTANMCTYSDIDLWELADWMERDPQAMSPQD